MNHMAIVVISQFGNFFYMAITEKEWKDVITEGMYEKYLMIQTTTSSVARYKIKGNQIKPQNVEKQWMKGTEERSEKSTKGNGNSESSQNSRGADKMNS